MGTFMKQNNTDSLKKNDYDHIITEIRAGKCLQIKSDLDLVHNAACERAIRIIQKYKDGEGLFQL